MVFAFGGGLHSSDCSVGSQGCRFLLKSESLAQWLQCMPRASRAVHKDHAGPSGQAPSAECFQYSELLLLGICKNPFIKLGIKLGQPSKVRAKQILPNLRTAFQCDQLCISSTPLAFSLLH